MRAKSEEGKKRADEIKRAEAEWERRRREATPLDIVAHRNEMKRRRARAAAQAERRRVEGAATHEQKLSDNIEHDNIEQYAAILAHGRPSADEAGQMCNGLWAIAQKVKKLEASSPSALIAAVEAEMTKKQADMKEIDDVIGEDGPDAERLQFKDLRQGNIDALSFVLNLLLQKAQTKIQTWGKPTASGSEAEG